MAVPMVVCVHGTNPHDLAYALKNASTCEHVSILEESAPKFFKKEHPCMGWFSIHNDPNQPIGIRFTNKKKQQKCVTTHTSSSLSSSYPFYLYTFRWTFSDTHVVHRTKNQHATNNDDDDNNDALFLEYIISKPYFRIYKKTQEEITHDAKKKRDTLFQTIHCYEETTDLQPQKRTLSPMFKNDNDNDDRLTHVDFDVFLKADLNDDFDTLSVYDRGIRLLNTPSVHFLKKEYPSRVVPIASFHVAPPTTATTAEHNNNDDDDLEWQKKTLSSDDRIVRIIATFRVNPLATKPFHTLKHCFSTLFKTLSKHRVDFYSNLRKNVEHVDHVNNNNDNNTEDDNKEAIIFQNAKEYYGDFMNVWLNDTTEKWVFDYMIADDADDDDDDHDDDDTISITLRSNREYDHSDIEKKSRHLCYFKKDEQQHRAHYPKDHDTMRYFHFESPHDISRFCLLLFYHSTNTFGERSDTAYYERLLKRHLETWSKKWSKAAYRSSEKEKEEQEESTIWNEKNLFMHLHHSSERLETEKNTLHDDDDDDDDDDYTDTVKHLEQLSHAVTLFCRIIDSLHVFLTDRVERVFIDEENIYKKHTAKTITQLQDLLNWISTVHLTNNGKASVQFEYKDDFTDTNLFSSLLDAHIETIWRKLVQESVETNQELSSKVVKMEPIDDFLKSNTNTPPSTTTDASKATHNETEETTHLKEGKQKGVMVDLYVLFGALLETIAVSKTIFLIYHRLVKECGLAGDHHQHHHNDNDTIRKNIIEKVERSIYESDYRVTKTTVTRLERDNDDDIDEDYSEKTVKLYETREKNALHVPKLFFITDVDDVVAIKTIMNVKTNFSDYFYEKTRSLHDHIVASQRICDDRSLFERVCGHYARMIQIDALNRLTHIPLYFYGSSNKEDGTARETTPNKHHIAFSLYFLKCDTDNRVEGDKRPSLCVLYDGDNTFDANASFLVSENDRTVFKQRFTKKNNDTPASSSSSSSSSSHRFRCQTETFDREDDISALRRYFYSEYETDRHRQKEEEGEEELVHYTTPLYAIFQNQTSNRNVQLSQHWYASLDKRVKKEDTYHTYQMKSLFFDLKRWLTDEQNILFWSNSDDDDDDKTKKR